MVPKPVIRILTMIQKLKESRAREEMNHSRVDDDENDDTSLKGGMNIGWREEKRMFCHDLPSESRVKSC